MEISKEQVMNSTIVSLKGRLDATTATALEQTFDEFIKNGQTKVLVECIELEYISSAGLRVLLAGAKLFKKASGEIALAGLSPNVKQVFEISGFTSIFPIYATREEFCRSQYLIKNGKYLGYKYTSKAFADSIMKVAKNDISELVKQRLN